MWAYQHNELWWASEDERAKVRMTTMDNKRFTSEYIGRYIAEHDSVDNSLRLSWSGDQLFLSEDEARALLAFLQHLYPFEDTMRYKTDTAIWKGRMLSGMCRGNGRFQRGGWLLLTGLFCAGR